MPAEVVDAEGPSVISRDEEFGADRTGDRQVEGLLDAVEAEHPGFEGCRHALQGGIEACAARTPVAIAAPNSSN
jgi:hypothetical protein